MEINRDHWNNETVFKMHWIKALFYAIVICLALWGSYQIGIEKHRRDMYEACSKDAEITFLKKRGRFKCSKLVGSDL